MQIPGVPGVMPQWFAPSPRLAILASCPEQYAPLNTLCCAPGTHSFASSDDADCLALPRLRLPAPACHRETSALFPDAARRPFVRCRQSTETVAPSDAAFSTSPAPSASGSADQTGHRYAP